MCGETVSVCCQWELDTLGRVRFVVWYTVDGDIIHERGLSVIMGANTHKKLCLCLKKLFCQKKPKILRVKFAMFGLQ